MTLIGRSGRLRKLLSMVGVSIALLALASQMHADAAPPAKPAAAGPITVVDATGRTVGRLNGYAALVTVNGTPHWFEMTDVPNESSRLRFQEDWILYFTASACSGQAYGPPRYLLKGAPSMLPVRLADGRLFGYPVPTGEPPIVPYLSYFYRGVCTDVQAGGGVSVFPLGAPVDLTPLFTPPFTLQ